MKNKQNQIKKTKEFVRGHFDDYEGRNLCYRKKAISEYGNEYKTGYYCYNCQNELIFQHEKSEDETPFRFHQILVKELEKRKDDWRTGRKTEYYKALCCRCADSCDCQEWIKKERAETQKEFSNLNRIVSKSKELVKALTLMKEHDDFQNAYSSQRLELFILSEEKTQEDSIVLKSAEEKHLAQLDQWEEKLQAHVSN